MDRPLDDGRRDDLRRRADPAVALLKRRPDGDAARRFESRDTRKLSGAKRPDPDVPGKYAFLLPYVAHDNNALGIALPVAGSYFWRRPLLGRPYCE